MQRREQKQQNRNCRGTKTEPCGTPKAREVKEDFKNTDRGSVWCDDVIILSLADSGLRVHGEEAPTEAESELTSSLSSAAENKHVNQTGASAPLDHILPSTPPTPPTTPRELTSAAVEESAETGDEEVYILLWCVDFFISNYRWCKKWFSIKRTGVWSKQGLRVVLPSPPPPIELKIRLSIWESYNEAKPKNLIIHSTLFQTFVSLIISRALVVCSWHCPLVVVHMYNSLQSSS